MDKLCSICAVFFIAVFSQTSKGFRIDESPLIVGGEQADIKDFPHHLALFNTQGYLCGASNIHSFWAMSAAHCLANNVPASQVTKLLVKFTNENNKTLSLDPVVRWIFKPLEWWSVFQC